MQEAVGTIAYQVDLPKADLVFKGQYYSLWSNNQTLIVVKIADCNFNVVHEHLQFIGSVDSNWTVGAVLEKKLQPLPFTFALSGMLNHNKNQFRLGCGLIIG